MKLKAKRILSLVLSAVMLLTLFCIVPSMSASADTETLLYASTYGTLINYSISDTETTQDGLAQKVGGISTSTNEQMQTYASMAANGFTDTKLPSYVTYRVKATQAGTYTLKMKIQPGGSIGTGYFVAMGVNDKNFYKSEEITTTGYMDVAFDVELEEGINLVRCFTRLGETQSLVGSGAWVNFDSLVIPSSLTGMLKGTQTKFAAQDAQNMRYDASGDTNVGNAGGHLSDLVAAAFTHETIKIGEIYKVPYLSYTVTVAESGYYDMAFTMNTSGNGAGYINAFVDGVKYKLYYKNVESWSGKNVSLYIPAGTHNITFTNVWGYDGGGAQNDEGYTNWCDFGELLIRNGDVVLAETAVEPWTIDDPTRAETDTDGTTFKFSDPKQSNSTASGKVISGNVGFDNNKGIYSTEANTIVDKSNVASVTFAVSAPADGTYTVKPGFYWNGSEGKTVTLQVNDNDAYVVPFSNMGTTNYNATSVDVVLSKGTNIIRIIPFTRDSNTESGAWINVDYLDIDSRLTKVSTAMTKIEAEDLPDENKSNFSTKSGTVTYKSIDYGVVGGANNSTIATSGVVACDFSFPALSVVPFVSLTVDAPADGWYDISASVATGATWIDETNYYIVMVKDGVPEARSFRPSTSSAKFIPSEENDANRTSDRGAIDLTTYLSEGTHTIAVTSPVAYDLDSVVENSYTWIDYEGFFVGQGITLAATQEVLEFNNTMYDTASAGFHNYYQRVYNSSKDSGFEALGFFPNFHTGGSMNNNTGNFDTLADALVNDSTPYIAYVIEAAEDGTYPINIRYKLGCTSTTTDDEAGRDAELSKYVETVGSYPFVPAIVDNGVEQKAFKMTYRALDSSGSFRSGWWQTATVNAPLKAGLNVIYLTGPSKEIRDIVNGVYVDFGAISIPSGLTLAEADLTMQGDANGDKEVNAADVLRLKKRIASSSTKIDKSADFNGNGSYDANDLVTMTKLVVNPAAVSEYSWLKASYRNSTGYTVTRSNPDNNVWMVKDSATVKTSRTSGKTNIDVSTTVITSSFSGFGASLTDTAAQNMALLTTEQLDEVMTDLFTASDDNLGLSWLRQPIGASDFANPLYTYDDVSQGETDTDLSEFSISHDTTAINSTNKLEAYNNTNNGHSMISLLKMAKEKGGSNLSFMATAWTAPLWMKTRWTWHTTPSSGVTSSLNTSYYSTYANYFYKYLQAYKDQGIDITYLGPQNEPSGQHGITSMYFSSTMMRNFVVNNLYSKITSFNSTYSKNVQLIGYDFNMNNGASSFLNSEMRGYYGAAAFHAYGVTAESPLDLSTFETYAEYFHNSGKKAFITEAAGNTSWWSFKDGYNTNMITYWNQPKNYFCNVNRTVAALRQKADGFFYWNIMLDDERGPVDTAGGGNSWGTGLMGFNRKSNEYYYTDDYYALAHFSKYIRKGASILSSTNTSSATDLAGLNNVVAKNTDGTYVMVINNDNNYVEEVSINTGLGYYIEYAVPGRSSVTLTWTANQLSSYVS